MAGLFGLLEITCMGFSASRRASLPAPIAYLPLPILTLLLAIDDFREPLALEGCRDSVHARATILHTKRAGSRIHLPDRCKPIPGACEQNVLFCTLRNINPRPRSRSQEHRSRPCPTPFDRCATPPIIVSNASLGQPLLARPVAEQRSGFCSTPNVNLLPPIFRWPTSSPAAHRVLEIPSRPTELC